MIEGKDNIGYDLICDNCGEIVEDFDEFMEAVTYAKEEGWRTIKNGNDWYHLCPDCKTPSVIEKFKS